MSHRLPPPPAFKKYIDRLIEDLPPRMNLAEYEVSWSFVKRVRGVPGLPPVPGTHNGYSAEVAIDPVYLTIDINVSHLALELFKQKDYALLARDIVHEFAHAYTFGLSLELEKYFHGDARKREWLRQVEESTTERIARTIFASLPRKLWIP